MFEEMIQARRTSVKEPIPCRVGMQARGETAPARMFVCLHVDVLERFGEAETFRVGVGSAEDRHLIRIAADPAGTFKPGHLPGGRGTTARPYRTFLLSPVARFPNCKIALQEVQFEWKAKALLITLPTWAWDEAAKRDAERAAARVPVKSAA